MKLWLDDIRPAPEGYLRAYTVDSAIDEILRCQEEADTCWAYYILGYCNREQFERRLAVWNIEEVSCDNDLGENEPEMMWQTTMNPETRRLISVTPADAKLTEQIFDTLMGDNLPARKVFIAEHGSEYLKDADI